MIYYRDFAKLVGEVTTKSSELEEQVVVGGFEEKTKLELILYSRDVLGVTALASLLLPYVTSDPNLVQEPPVSNQKVSMETLEERLRTYEKTTERINDTPRLLDMGSKFPRASMLLDLENKSQHSLIFFSFFFSVCLLDPTLSLFFLISSSFYSHRCDETPVIAVDLRVRQHLGEPEGEASPEGGWEHLEREGICPGQFC